jgi:hypothetical protein
MEEVVLDLVLILWLPVTIAIMAVTWVLTLGALGQIQPAAEEPSANIGVPATRR